MQLKIKGKNMEITDAVRNYVEKKISKLDRYLDNITDTEVEITRENTRSLEGRQIVQVTMTANGSILRGEEKAADVYAAIDAVADVMERQIKRYKGKRSQASKGGGARAEPTLPEETATEENEPRIARTKRFNIKPMSEDEAVEQMELLGHTFFVFVNEDTEEVNVVYKRKDGNYGILVPERA